MNVQGIKYLAIVLIFSISISGNSQKKVTKQDQFKLLESQKNQNTWQHYSKMPIYTPDINLDKQIILDTSTNYEKMLMPIYSPFSLALTNPKQQLWRKKKIKRFKRSKK